MAQMSLAASLAGLANLCPLFTTQKVMINLSSFPLIQHSFVKLVQLAQCDKNTNARQYMLLVAVWETQPAEKAM